MSDLSRRDAIRVIGAAAGAIGIAVIPDAWEKPAIEAANLPVAAAASPVPTATVAPTATTVPTATATQSPTATMVPTATVTPVPEILSVTITKPTTRVYDTRFPFALGTSTPGSLVTVWIHGYGYQAAEATSAANGDWSWEMPTFSIEAESTTYRIEATATKPPSAPAHAGPEFFGFSRYFD